MYIYVLHCTSLCNINHGEPILSEEMAVSSPHFEWTNTTHCAALFFCTFSSTRIGKGKLCLPGSLSIGT